MIKADKAYEYASGLIELSFQFESNSALCIMSSISKLDTNCRIHIGIMNLNPDNSTITASTRAVKFKFLTSKRVSFIKSIDPSSCSLIKTMNTTIAILNQHIICVDKHLKKGLMAFGFRHLKIVKAPGTLSEYKRKLMSLNEI